MQNLQPALGPALPQRHGYLHGGQTAAQELEWRGGRALGRVQRFQGWFQRLDRKQSPWLCAASDVDAELAEAQGGTVSQLQLPLVHVYTGDLGDHQRNAGPIAEAAKVNGDLRAFVMAGDQAGNHPGIQR